MCRGSDGARIQDSNFHVENWTSDYVCSKTLRGGRRVLENVLPDAVAVYLAHVPVVYHVPALIKHPLLVLPTYASK